MQLLIMITKFTMKSCRKRAKNLKELAEKNCEKHMKEFMKKQQRMECSDYLDGGSKTLSAQKSNMLSTIKQKIWSSQGNLSKSTKDLSTCGSSINSSNSSTKFSELVGSGSSIAGGSIVCRSSALAQKKHKIRNRSKTCDSFDAAFKIGEIENDGRRTVTSLMGVQRDSEVLYVGNFNSGDEQNARRGKINDVFDMAAEGNSDNETDANRSAYGTLSRSFSQPNFLDDATSTTQKLQEINEEIIIQRPTGLFDRPMLGSIAFRRSVTAALSHLHPASYAADSETNSTLSACVKDDASTTASSVTTAKLRANNKAGRKFLNLSDSDSDGLVEAFGDDEDEDDAAYSSIHRFLTAWGLEEYLNMYV